MPKYKGKEYSYTKTGVNKFLEEKQKDLRKENNRLTRKSAPNKYKFNNKTDSDNYGKISKKMLNIALLKEELNKSKNKNLSKNQKDKLIKMEKKGLI